MFKWLQNTTEQRYDFKEGLHSSVLAWRIPGTEEPSGLLSVGSHRVGHDWSDLAAGKIYREMYNLPKKNFFKRSEKGVGPEVSSPQSSCWPNQSFTWEESREPRAFSTQVQPLPGAELPKCQAPFWGKTITQMAWSFVDYPVLCFIES